MPEMSLFFEPTRTAEPRQEIPEPSVDQRTNAPMETEEGIVSENLGNVEEIGDKGQDPD